MRNNIPHNWIEARTGELFEMVGGGTPSTKTSEYWNGDFPWITSADISEDHRITPRRTVSTRGIAESATNKVPVGTLIVATRVGLGKSAVAEAPMCFSQDCQGLIVPGKRLDSGFLMYQIETITSEFIRQSQGTTIRGITKKALADLKLRIAPTQEQHRIVEAIESYLTRLDAAVASLERVQRNLKRYRASVLKAAVEGRLVPTEAELARQERREYESASELLERILTEREQRWIEDAAEKARAKAEDKARKAGKPWTHVDNVKTLEKERAKAAKKYKEPVAPDLSALGAQAGTSNLPGLPEGWRWVTIAQLASAKPHSLTDGPFGSNLKTEHYTEAGPRVIRLQNIGDGQFINAEAHISDDHYERLKKHAAYPGDVVIASLGVELPKACLVPNRLGQAIVKADCLRLKPNARLVDRHYLMHALNSRPIRRQTEALAHGMGRPRIGLTLLRTIPVPLPPRAEQRRIANRIDTLLSITENMVQLLERQNLRTARLRQSILKWAFEGKLVEQDPNDEPALALLERIKEKYSQPRRSR